MNAYIVSALLLVAVCGIAVALGRVLHEPEYDAAQLQREWDQLDRDLDEGPQ